MASLYTVHASDGLPVLANPITGDLFVGNAPGLDVLLCLPQGMAGVGFLLTSDVDLRLRVQADLVGSPILPVRLQVECGFGLAAVLHPFTGLYMSASAPALDEDHSAVTIRSHGRSVAEAFALTACPELPPQLTETLAQLDILAALPLTGPAILQLLEAGVPPKAGQAFDAYARLLQLDQAEWLAAALLRSGTAVANLALALPHDPFAADTLPGLLRWVGPRHAATRLELAWAQDDLALTGIHGAYSSAPHHWNALARRTVAPQGTLAVLATARNEGLYLVEWLAHHRTLGIERFFVYSNDNTDGSDALLHALAEAGAITWVDNQVAPRGTAQFQAYGHALGALPQILDSRWTLILDLDEFLCLDRSRFASLRDYMAWQEARPVDAVAFNWVVFGSSGETEWRDAPVTQRFVHRLPWTDHHIKTMVRTGQAMHARPHHPVFDPRQAVVTRNASGDVHGHKEEASWSMHPEEGNAWINHYMLKSAEEFIWKASRNRGDQPMMEMAEPTEMNIMFADLFLNQHTSPTMQRDCRIQADAGALASETGRLMLLPGVSQAMQQVKSIREQQAVRLRGMILNAPIFQQAGTLQNRLGKLVGA